MNKPAPMPALIEQHTVADKKTKPVAIFDLVTEGMQLRVSISQEAVARYAEAYAEKADIPAIVVFLDPKTDTKYLADGHHRVAAAKKAGLTKLDAIIKQGTVLDALLYSARSNTAHGEPLTNDDKRHTVARFFDIPEWRRKSDRWIATAAQVNPHLVAKVRKSLPKEQQSTVRESKDGVTRDTKNIAKKAKQPKAQQRQTSPAKLDDDDRAVIRDIASFAVVLMNHDDFARMPYPFLLVLSACAFYPASDDCPIPYGMLAQSSDPASDLDDTLDKMIDKALLHAESNRGYFPSMDLGAQLDAVYRAWREDLKKTAATPEPEELNAATIASTAGEPADERSTPPIADDTPAAKVLKRTREILAERLLKGKDQCTATSEQLVSLGLVVGIPVSADDEPWNDDLVAGCWHKLTVRLQAELADYLTRGETRRLPPLAQLASWWGIDVRAIAIQAERAVGG